MVYCTQCGSRVEGRYCQQCGTATDPQSAAPQTPAPAAQPGVPAAPVARKRSPLVWVLAGCLGLIAIIAVGAISAGLFFAHKARQAGVDTELFRRNPALAVSKMLTVFDSDLEVLSVNEDTGLITVREKSTGKTLTMNFEDMKKGRIVLTDENGERVHIQGGRGGGRGSVTVKTKDGVFNAGAGWTPPGWVPVYSGARVEAGADSQSGDEEAGGGTLVTNDSPEDVLKFYEDALRTDGFRVSRGPGGNNTVTGDKDDAKRHIIVKVAPAGRGANIHLTYSTRN